MIFIVHEIFKYFNGSTKNILAYASNSSLCVIIYVLKCMKQAHFQYIIMFSKILN